MKQGQDPVVFTCSLEPLYICPPITWDLIIYPHTGQRRTGSWRGVGKGSQAQPQKWAQEESLKKKGSAA